jgi:hypothetical protein
VPAPFERRAIAFDGKPVVFFVDAQPRLGRPFLARCHGATLSAEEERLTEDQYVARILDTATEMGLVATVSRRDERELVFEVRTPAKR